MKNKLYYFIIVIAGLLLIGYSVFINIISPDFTYAASPSKDSLIYYILVRIFIGLVYTIAVVVLIRSRLTAKKIIIFIFSVGFVSRILLIPSEPILEDDFNRYLWDGAVTASGYNPFQFSPNQFMSTDSLNVNLPYKLYDIAKESGSIIDKINHPHIRTIYPPVAQAAFATAYLIKPWSVSIWKSLLLLIDILVFYLLILVLKKVKSNSLLIIIYWWNPILLHEIFNAGHMDLLMFPFLVGAILFYLDKKYIVSSSLISIAVGVKIWPIIFVPFLIKKVWNNKKLLLRLGSISSLIILLLLIPIIITKIDDSLGFVTYSKNWTNNESVFQIINIIIKQIIYLFDINYHCSLCVARWVTILIFGLILIYFLKKSDTNNYNFITIAFLLVAIMYIISPTQFPWYYTWVLPFLVFTPRLSFVAYAIFLPLYQLKYSWAFLVWIEHIPILLLFIVELVYLRTQRVLTISSIKKN